MIACRTVQIFNLIKLLFSKAATAGRIGTWCLVVSTLCIVARAGDYEQ